MATVQMIGRPADPRAVRPEERLLERVALALNSTLELREVLLLLAEATLEASGADRCSLFLLEGQTLQPAVAIGKEQNEDLWTAFRAMGPVDLDRIPNGWLYLRQGRAVGVEDATHCELVPHSWAKRFSLRSVALVPLLAAGEPCGLMALDYHVRRSVTEPELSVLEAIGASAGVAVRNARLFGRLERQLRRLEVLYELSTVTDRRGPGTLAERLRARLARRGVALAGVALRDQRLADHLGAETETAEERGTWRAGRTWARLPDGVLAVPMRLGRRIVGSLRVRAPDPDLEERSFLEAVGREIAEVAHREALREAIEEGRRERAVAAERDRIGSDLHDTVGQLLVAIGLLARQQAGHLPTDSPWVERILRLAELAEQGKWEIDQSIRALAFVPGPRRKLAPALRALARSFETDSGIHVLVEVSSDRLRLSSRAERALYRVAHEALANAWRHARCSAVRLSLDLASSEVVLRVRDDGVGLGPRAGREGSRVGIAGMRRAMGEVGGSLRVRSARPRGVLVEARVPGEGR